MDKTHKEGNGSIEGEGSVEGEVSKVNEKLPASNAKAAS